MSFIWLVLDVKKKKEKEKRKKKKRWLFYDVSETSKKYLLQVFVTFQKYPTKMVSCNFGRIIEITDKQMWGH